MAMRGYEVYCKHYNTPKSKALTDAPHKVCFSFINAYKWYELEKEIYLYKFECEETKDYVERLLFIINKITPCELVTINKVKYIKFKLLKTYDTSLILLNFIRTLWYNPIPIYANPDDKLKYIKEFFGILMKAKRVGDPVRLLTKANKLAILSLDKSTGYYGHSNIHNGDNLKIKSKKQLLEYKGHSTKEFLCKD